MSYTINKRSASRVNHKDLHRAGNQLYQEAKISSNERHIETHLRIPDLFKQVTEIVMLQEGDGSEYDQMGATAGIKLRDKEVIAAIIQEYKHPKQMENVVPLYVHKLSHNQK